MAAKEEAPGAEEAPKPPRKPLNIPLLLALANTVVILGVTGLMVYTRLIFRRTQITEATERARLAKLHEKQEKQVLPGMMQFEPFTINILSNPAQPHPADGTVRQIQGKLHYATVGFALELRDNRFQDQVDKIRPMLMDQVLGMLGRKSFQDLITVQGRYALRSQILDHANRLAMADSGDEHPIVSQIFFTQFIVQ